MICVLILSFLRTFSNRTIFHFDTFNINSSVTNLNHLIMNQKMNIWLNTVMFRVVFKHAAVSQQVTLGAEWQTKKYLIVSLISANHFVMRFAWKRSVGNDLAWLYQLSEHILMVNTMLYFLYIKFFNFNNFPFTPKNFRPWIKLLTIYLFFPLAFNSNSCMYKIIILNTYMV